MFFGMECAVLDWVAVDESVEVFVGCCWLDLRSLWEMKFFVILKF